MRLILLAIISSIFVTDAQALKIDAADVIQIRTVALNRTAPIYTVVNGTISGIETAPKGDFQVRVTNGESFKGDTFNKIYCTILPLKEINYRKGESVPLATEFDVKGKTYSAFGFYSGSTAAPVEGYEMLIKNGKNRGEWNTLNCRIK